MNAEFLRNPHPSQQTGKTLMTENVYNCFVLKSPKMPNILVSFYSPQTPACECGCEQSGRFTGAEGGFRGAEGQPLEGHHIPRASPESLK